MRAGTRSFATVAVISALVVGACGQPVPDTDAQASAAVSPAATVAVSLASLPPAPTRSPTSSPAALLPLASPVPTILSTSAPASSPAMALAMVEPEPPAPAAADTSGLEASPAASPAITPPVTSVVSPVPSASPIPVASSSPFPSFAPQIIGYVIDPATALPVVPEGVGGPWWWEGPPPLPIDPSLRYASEAPTGEAIDPDQRRVSLLALFDTHADARAIGEALAAAAGDPAAEAAWLQAAGQDGSAGFGWIGSAGSTTPFVQVIDRWLVVSELAYDPQYDPGDDLEASPRYASPLVVALAEIARELVVEDTWARDKSVAFDLACRGDPARLLTLSQDLADNAEIYDMQPVWIEPGITSEQRRARRTLRLLDTLDNATLSALVGDTEFQRRATNVRDAGAGGTVATEEALADLAAYIEEWVLASRPDLEPLAYLLDADVLQVSAAQFARRAAVEVLAGQLTRPQDVASGQFAAAPYGAHHAPIPWIMGEAPSFAEQQDDRLTMSLGLFHGVAAGLGPLLDHLVANGCEDVRVKFLDYGRGVSLRQ